MHRVNDWSGYACAWHGNGVQPFNSKRKGKEGEGIGTIRAQAQNNPTLLCGVSETKIIIFSKRSYYMLTNQLITRNMYKISERDKHWPRTNKRSLAKPTLNAVVWCLIHLSQSVLWHLLVTLNPSQNYDLFNVILVNGYNMLHNEWMTETIITCLIYGWQKAQHNSACTN